MRRPFADTSIPIALVTGRSLGKLPEEIAVTVVTRPSASDGDARRRAIRIPADRARRPDRLVLPVEVIRV